MKEGYKVLEASGIGKYIGVYNYKFLNEIGTFRFSDINYLLGSDNLVGIWKPKLIKQQ